MTKFGLNLSLYLQDYTIFGQLSAVEIKYGERSRKQKPKAFDQAYPDASFSIVDRDNYLDFIC